MVPTVFKWIVVVSALFNYGFMLVDGSKAILTGGYFRPKTGKFARQLGPWSKVISTAGIDPESSLMKVLFILWGLTGLTIAVCFAINLQWAWVGLLLVSISILWYLVPGTMLSVLQIVLLLFLTNCKNAPHQFTYASPESKGFSSEKFEVLKNHLEKSGSSAIWIMVVGEVILDWGETARIHTIHSIRKALLNSLIGIAVERGLLDTTWTLRELGIQDIEPRLTEQELNARVADLLKSRSGVYHHAAGVSEGMLQGMPERGAYEPGEHFYYNNWDFNTLGAILEQVTGVSIYDLFYTEIARPLGMHDYRGRYSTVDGESEEAELPDTDGFYQYELSKSKYPAFHFCMSARDLALYGQLYLNKGKWNGTQIVPEQWIETSTKAYSIINEDFGMGYGMLWYVLLPRGERSASFNHTGVGIHMVAVYPAVNMVLVHRVDTENVFDYDRGDFFKMIDLVWDSFL